MTWCQVGRAVRHEAPPHVQVHAHCPSLVRWIVGWW